MKRATSIREKILISAMMGVVSLFLFQRLVVIPYRSNWDELEATTARKERQLRRIQGMMDSRVEIESEYNRRFEHRAGGGARSVQGEMGDFLKNIEKGARKNNVKIRDIRPRAVEDQAKNTILSASFVTESSWSALARLLLSLEENRVVVEKMTLTRSAHSDQTIKAQIQLIHES